MAEEILDPTVAIETYADPTPMIRRWIRAELDAERSAIDVAADLRERADSYASDSPAHQGLADYAERVENGWLPEDVPGG